MSPWCCFMDCVVEAMYRSGMLLSTHRPINRMNSLLTPKALRAEAPPWRRLCVLWTEASIPIADGRSERYRSEAWTADCRIVSDVADDL